MVVLFVLADLRGEIVRRPDRRGGELEGVAQDTGDPKVAELHQAGFGEKNISALEISVQDLPVVHVFESHANLDHQVQDFVLRDETVARAMALDLRAAQGRR